MREQNKRVSMPNIQELSEKETMAVSAGNGLLSAIVLIVAALTGCATMPNKGHDD